LEKKRKNSKGKIIKSNRGLIGNILWFFLGKNLWPQNKVHLFLIYQNKIFHPFERYLKRNSCVGGHNAGISFHSSVISKKFAKEMSNWIKE